MHASLALPILYTFRRCPYAMRARMAIAVAGVAVTQVEVVLSAKPEAMLRLSPKGTVPVLVLSDNTVLEQSLAIMQWALMRSDPENWLRDNALMSPLITLNDGDFKACLDKYKYANRYPELPLAAHRENAFKYLKLFAEPLRKQPYLQGNALSATDIAIMPFVRQCAQVDREWFNNMAENGLNTWLCGIEKSTLLTQIMAKNYSSL